MSVSRASPLGRTTFSKIVPTPLMTTLLPSATKISPVVALVQSCKLVLSRQDRGTYGVLHHCRRSTFRKRTSSLRVHSPTKLQTILDRSRCLHHDIVPTRHCSPRVHNHCRRVGLLDFHSSASSNINPRCVLPSRRMCTCMARVQC